MYKAGGFCEAVRPIIFQGGRFDTGQEKGLVAAFREELAKANFPMVGDPSALFEDRSERKAEILVAALVTNMKMDICFPAVDWGSMTSKGYATLTVEWQIYDPIERRVVHKVTTKGTGVAERRIDNGEAAVLNSAFAEATRGLLADQGFHALVSEKKSSPTIAAAAPASLQLRKLRLHSGPITGRIAQIQAGVVTVFTGRGHGSGFFVSADGLLITNHHVVGEARFVKVKLSTGREILGDVLTSDPRRDVALIKTQESGFAALPIAAAELPAGSEIYAFGSPLDERLSNTVTRGIISAYRTEDGMRFIQGDVAVQGGNSGGPITDGSGNVVGITVSGIGEMNTGLNFFIPIDDALRSLGITLTNTGTARR